MFKRETGLRCAVLLGVVATAWACADTPTGTAVRVPSASYEAVKFWDALATTRWNLRATDLLQGLPANTLSNGQAWASRMLTYLSLAQYRAVLAATAPSERPIHASASAAVTRASFEVLDAFFKSAPGVPAAVKQRISDQLQQQLIDDRTAPTWPGEANEDVAAGDEIGHAVGAEVWQQSQIDGYLTASTPFAAMVRDRGVRENDWYPATGVALVRSLWGTTPFFLGQEELLLPRDPPAMLTDAFPSERAPLESQVEEAGMSRVYAGIHYHFDIEAGQEVGRLAAAKALAGSLK